MCGLLLGSLNFLLCNYLRKRYLFLCCRLYYKIYSLFIESAIHTHKYSYYICIYTSTHTVNKCAQRLYSLVKGQTRGNVDSLICWWPLELNLLYSSFSLFNTNLCSIIYPLRLSKVIYSQDKCQAQHIAMLGHPLEQAKDKKGVTEGEGPADSACLPRFS